MSPKEVVRRYFEALDAGNPDAVPELFSADCKIYRPERREPLVGIEMVQLVVTMAHRIYRELHTEILDLVSEADIVAVRVRHNAVYDGEWRTRVGTFECTGKPTSWEAMALFRLQGNRIAEERVYRDELGMLLDVGAIEPANG